MTQRIVPVIAKNILNAYIILMGAYAAINRVRAVTATLYAPQYEHTLISLGSVLFRSFASELTYDSHVEGNALLSLSSRGIIIRIPKTCQAFRSPRFIDISTTICSGLSARITKWRVNYSFC